jgi:hypothetical protein
LYASICTEHTVAELSAHARMFCDAAARHCAAVWAAVSVCRHC